MSNNAQTATQHLITARDEGADRATWHLQAAQVHATLALAEELRRLIQVIRERP